ncbi:hypothetical protein FWH30_01675 [Microgenomates group bacterium]|nr:hypothetical protein [Microgenomates group bacterium]
MKKTAQSSNLSCDKTLKVVPERKAYMKIEAAEAFKRAAEYFVDIMPEKANYSNPKLEEIELDKDKGVWSVTISYTNINQNNEDPLAVFYGAPTKREFKVINVDFNTGEVLSMKLRS